MSHPDIWHTKFCLALGYLRGLVEVWGEIWPNAWLDLDSARLQRSVSQPYIFSTSRDIYSHKLSQNRAPGKKPVIVFNWVKLSCSFSSAHSRSFWRKKEQRCGAVFHWAPGGSVVQDLSQPAVLYCKAVWNTHAGLVISTEQSPKTSQ